MLYRLLSWLPLPCLYLLAWPGYLFLYYLAGYRKAVVRQNLTQAFPDKSVSDITVLEKKFYRQLVQVALEILKTRRMSASQITQRVTVTNGELIKEYSRGFKDCVIILTIHQGNWEWMMHAVKLELDIPIDPVYKPLHNKTLDRVVLEGRARFGSRPVPLASAARDILRHRREFRVLAMVADQAPVPGERSYWTRFMHREAAFYEGAESLARATGFPVLFARCRRRSTGRYEVVFKEVAQAPYGPPDNDITERYVRLAEEAIREEPESWLWSNRRWKRQREAASG